jgi:hypothetical protein
LKKWATRLEFGTPTCQGGSENKKGRHESLQMANFSQLISSLREQMNATLSRSDVLKPLAWLIGTLTITTVLMVYVQSPNWLLVVMAMLLVAIIILYGWAYGFCLLKDRDALRSEKYSLHKMAIEHRLIGDNSTGLFEPDETNQAPMGRVGATKQIEHEP